MDESPTGKAILLTPPGGAAIAVVRLVGMGVDVFLREHFSRSAREGRCVHGELREGDRVIDDPVVVLHPGGRAADVNLHGGPWVVRSALDLAKRRGFEVIDVPGVPPPDEAVDGGTELERDVIAHLPLARTELGLRALLAQRQAWEDVTRMTPGEVSAVLADRGLWWLLHPPRVPVVGGANVGKSTLANQLFARERSITADLPGTTRDWVGEIADVNGLPVMLVDTPGLRATADPIERAALERSKEQITAAELVVLVLDPTRPLEPEQSPLLAAYPDSLRVINKSDRRAIWKVSDAGQRPVIHTAATSGEGVDDLRRAIAAHFGCDGMDPQRPRWWTERQRRVLQARQEDSS